MRMENSVETAMRKQIDELSRMTVVQLRQKYLEVFGEGSRSNHKQFLFRRIAWRIQALAEGGLSPFLVQVTLSLKDPCVDSSRG